jgi:predicted RNA-binding protein YlxR (DUF448 family)
MAEEYVLSTKEHVIQAVAELKQWAIRVETPSYHSGRGRYVIIANRCIDDAYLFSNIEVQFSIKRCYEAREYLMKAEGK